MLCLKELARHFKNYLELAFYSELEEYMGYKCFMLNIFTLVKHSEEYAGKNY